MIRSHWLRWCALPAVAIALALTGASLCQPEVAIPAGTNPKPITVEGIVYDGATPDQATQGAKVGGYDGKGNDVSKLETTDDKGFYKLTIPAGKLKGAKPAFSITYVHPDWPPPDRAAARRS